MADNIHGPTDARDEMRTWTTTKRLPLAAVALVLACTGCSTRTLYDSAQGSRRLQCQKIEEPSARNKCLADAGISYDDYKRQSESAKTNK